MAGVAALVLLGAVPFRLPWIIEGDRVQESTATSPPALASSSPDSEPRIAIAAGAWGAAVAGDGCLVRGAPRDMRRPHQRGVLVGPGALAAGGRLSADQFLCCPVILGLCV